MALLVVFVLSSCPDPLREPTASLTISLGSGSRAVTYPPNETTFARLVHTIELSGPSGEQQTHELSVGKSSITITLATGKWEIIVMASLDNEPYAEGSAEVVAGEKVSVALVMRQIASPVLSEYTVTFNSSGGSAIQSQTVKEREKAVKPGDPGLEGLTFVGWYKDSGLALIWDFDNDIVIANITLYAKWLPVFTVTFDSNEGSEIPSQTVTQGKKAVKPANPTKAGYGFVGWYTDTVLTAAYMFGTTVTVDITLYAK